MNKKAVWCGEDRILPPHGYVFNGRELTLSAKEYDSLKKQGLISSKTQKKVKEEK